MIGFNYWLIVYLILFWVTVTYLWPWYTNIHHSWVTYLSTAFQHFPTDAHTLPELQPQPQPQQQPTPTTLILLPLFAIFPKWPILLTSHPKPQPCSLYPYQHATRITNWVDVNMFLMIIGTGFVRRNRQYDCAVSLVRVIVEWIGCKLCVDLCVKGWVGLCWGDLECLAVLRLFCYGRLCAHCREYPYLILHLDTYFFSTKHIPTHS